MIQKDVLKNLLILFGTILLALTAYEYLVYVFAIAIDPILTYWIQTFYLFSIFIFIVLLVIFLNPESPKKDMS